MSGQESTSQQTQQTQQTQSQGESKPSRDLLPDGAADEKVEVKVAGETKIMTRGEMADALDKMKTEYAHYGGAAQAMNKAKELEGQARGDMEKASQGLRFMELTEKVQTGTATIDDLKAYCDLAKVPEDQRQEIIYGTSSEDTGAQKGEEGGSEGAQEPKLVTEDQLDPAVREKLAALEQVKQRQGEEEFQEYAKQGLDSVEGFGKIVSSLTDRGVKEDDIEKVRQDLVESVRSETLLRVQRGKAYGPTLVKDAAKTVIDKIERIGIQTPTPTTPAVPGLGPAEAASMSAVFQEGQEPKRVPSGQGNDQSWADSAVKRFFYRLGKAAKS